MPFTKLGLKVGNNLGIMQELREDLYLLKNNYDISLHVSMDKQVMLKVLSKLLLLDKTVIGVQLFKMMNGQHLVLTQEKEIISKLVIIPLIGQEKVIMKMAVFQVGHLIILKPHIIATWLLFINAMELISGSYIHQEE